MGNKIGIVNVTPELKAFIIEEQKVFTNKVKEKAESQGVFLDVKVQMFAYVPINSKEIKE